MCYRQSTDGAVVVTNDAAWRLITLHHQSLCCMYYIDCRHKNAATAANNNNVKLPDRRRSRPLHRCIIYVANFVTYVMFRLVEFW